MKNPVNNLLNGSLAALLLLAGATLRADDAKPAEVGTNTIQVATNSTAVAATAAHTNSTVAAPSPTSGLDLKSFEIIYKRNMFSPDRSPRRTSAPAPRPKRTDSFTLVGTVSYEKGDFALFDGSGSDYRKSLKVSDKIAGYKIVEIGTDHVLFGASSNRTVRFPVGSQMRRREGETWKMAGQSEAVPESESTVSSSDSGSNASSTSASSGSSSPAAASGAESDIIKRLMARRAAEK